MNNLLKTCFCALSLAATAPVAASGIVLGFDDITTATGAASVQTVPAGYAGFDWTLLTMHKDYIAGSGYNQGAVSGNYITWQNSGSVTSNFGLFNFLGGYFTAAWDTAMDLVLEGSAGSVLLFSQTVSVNNLSPTWVSANFFGIDELKITSLGSQFVLDDFTYSHVAEPMPIATLGLGLVYLILIRKRRARIAKQ